MQWQETGLDSDDETQPNFVTATWSVEKMNDEKEDKEMLQLKKFQDPSKDMQRKALVSVVEKFGALFITENSQNIQDLFTGDFEAFIFNSTGREKFRHFQGLQGFLAFFQGRKVHERSIRTTDVDFDKTTVCQVCVYQVTYQNEVELCNEIACEIFSLTNGRISKYRACFGTPASNIEEFDNFMAPTRKDKMLTKVKEINYALAGQPNFEKVASLFHENTEYKIWRWGDSKGFTLNKSNFVSSFENLQENMMITSIVPYEMSTNTQSRYVSATYVYHLQERSSGKKYIWLTMCSYGFDEDINLAKISQQGETYLEGKIEVPFEVSSKEMTIKKVTDFPIDVELDNLFYEEKILYDCSFYSLMPKGVPNPGFYQGLKEFSKLSMISELRKSATLESIKNIDYFVDHYNESHDVVFGSGVVEGIWINQNKEEVRYAVINFTVLALENGKIAKRLDFSSGIDFPIPSPFDDKRVQSIHFT